MQHINEAIQPLIGLIDTTTNIKAKKSAIYTLHLIGINSVIAGRVYEEFRNKNARNALLKYLDDTALNETVIYLLKRDPWLSYVPKLIAYLDLPGKDYSKVLSALNRYEISNRPMCQRITGSIFERPIKVKTTDQYSWVPMSGLVVFQKKFGKKFLGDEEITTSPEWAKSIEELSDTKTPSRKISVIPDLIPHYFFSYSESGDQCNYTFDGKQITVYGPTKAREIWLKWWEEIPQNEKDNLFHSDHIPFNSKN